MPPLPDEHNPDRGASRGAGEDRLPPAAPGQGRRPPEGQASEGVPSPTMPEADAPMERPDSATPPRQEPQPPPSLQRWVFGVGGAVVLFAIVWALINAS